MPAKPPTIEPQRMALEPILLSPINVKISFVSPRFFSLLLLYVHLWLANLGMTKERRQP